MKTLREHIQMIHDSEQAPEQSNVWVGTVLRESYQEAKVRIEANSKEEAEEILSQMEIPADQFQEYNWDERNRWVEPSSVK